MKARFQADADFSQRIVSAVRRSELAIDFQSANVANLRGLSDPDVLSLAARDSRALVSHDLTTMPNHFAKFVETNTSAGLLIIRQRVSNHVALHVIVRAWIQTEAEEWVNQMRVV